VVPSAVRVEAAFAGPLLVTIWVEKRMLIQRNCVFGVSGAEDPPALAAVVSSIK